MSGIRSDFEIVRASRLVSILHLLQSRVQLTAAELAEELKVSESIISLILFDSGAAGVPVVGERGIGGGYRLRDGYRTNLAGLTTEEAGALLMAGAAGPAPDDFTLARSWETWETDCVASLPAFSVLVRVGPLAQRQRDDLSAR